MEIENNYSLCVSCTFGLESVVKKEIRDLGYETEQVSDGSISLKGNASDILKLNLNLAAADRVYIECGSGSAASFDELFDLTESIPWEIYFSKNARVDIIKATCVKSQLMSEADCQRIVKKAIVNRLMKHYKTASLPESGEYFGVVVHIKDDFVRILINTSGDGLNRRGYRGSFGTAPIKETLAAGIIRLSSLTPDRQFADVMCGSGTFTIEAALYQAGIAPGLTRSFACEGWKMLGEKTALIIREETAAKIKTPVLRALGSDIDKTMVKAAIENAARAGVGEATAFQKMDLSDFQSRKKHGVIAVNPPYGKRLGEKKSVAELYKKLGVLYKNLSDWQMVVITSDENFEKAFGAKANKNRKLFNGNIKSYLYFFGE